MASCSTAGKYYQFNTAGGAYHSTSVAKRQAPSATPVAVTTTTTTPQVTAETAPVTAEASTSVTPAAAPTPSAYLAVAVPATQVASAVATPSPAVSAEQVKLEKRIAKVAHKLEVRAAKAAAKPEATHGDGGKSQLTAALLCFFLGGLSIHRFYLGYTGIAILQIILNLLVVGYIWWIIDFIRILMGRLTPKSGEYAKKF